MKTVAFLLLLQSFLSIKEVFGNDMLENDPDKDCMIKFKNCFLSRNCESRVKSLDYYCCKKSFENGTYDESLEEECLDNRMLTDLYDCLDMLSEKCEKNIMKYFTMNEEKFAKIEAEVKEAIGTPESIKDCVHYAERVEMEECLFCVDKDDNDNVYGFICDIIRSTRKSSPYCTREKKCMDVFNNCMLSKITEAQLNKIDVKCCKQVLNKPGDYFENKDDCIEEDILPVLMECVLDNKQYAHQILNYYSKNEEAIDEFDQSVRNKTGIPPDESKCNDYYEKEKRITLEKCLFNDNKDLFPFCELLQKLLLNKDSNNYIQYGMNNKLKK
ncbi:uncharacterized protein LOC111623328 [Centruroides sculpturatus]|uniref:uncharacterized protein LOC111623328 n=1 Tax=Centruroides sculpturatus TaxID=218467 RepID=UPI000C6D314B|nr:uncharacterized protein LOC111623328 [Centruroides sculpturatus]